MRSSLLICILFLLVSPLVAQDCDNAVPSAYEHYSNGNFAKAVSELEPCYENKRLHREANLAAARLLAMCYIVLRSEDKAQFYASEMLRIEPNYMDYPNIDPAELSRLLRTFEVSVKWNAGFEFGPSLNQVKLIKNYSTDNSPSTFRMKGGLNAGLLIQRNLTSSSSVVGGLTYNVMNYERELDNIAGDKKVFKEVINSFSVPLSFRQSLHFKKWSLFFDLGGHYRRIANSYADLKATNLVDGSVFQSSTRTTPYRNLNVYGAQTGFGVARSLGTAKLAIHAQYWHMIPNLTKQGTRYDNTDFILSSHYIDPDFSVNSFGLSFSYLFPINYQITSRQ